MYIARNLQVSCLCKYSINDVSGAGQWVRAPENAERTADPFQGKGKRLSVATFRSRSQFLESKEGSALLECEGPLPKEDYPCNHICNYALYNFCYLCYQPCFRGHHSMNKRTTVERSHRTECAFFCRFCILSSISCDSYELDPCRGGPSRPSSSAWAMPSDSLALQFGNQKTQCQDKHTSSPILSRLP